MNKRGKRFASVFFGVLGLFGFILMVNRVAEALSSKSDAEVLTGVVVLALVSASLVAWLSQGGSK